MRVSTVRTASHITDPNEFHLHLKAGGAPMRLRAATNELASCWIIETCRNIQYYNEIGRGR